MHIVVCDDNKQILESVEKTIRGSFPESKLSLFDSFEALSKNDFEESSAPDILIMDIVLGKKNGIELAAKLKNIYNHMQTIFITGYPSVYYENIFESITPIGFLGKPFSESRMIHFINKAIEKILEETRTIQIKQRNKMLNLQTSEIVYVEKVNRKLHFGLLNEDMQTESYMKIEELYLDELDFFVRCHKSFLINMNYIKSFSPNEIVMVTGKIISVSRAYKDAVRKKYFGFRGNL